MSIYDDLNVRTFLNAYGPLTRLGGALMSDCVVGAMVEASRRNVDLAELQSKVGEAIATLTTNDAAYVSCGAASGITLAVATCMAGTDPLLSDQLPNVHGMKDRVVMHAGDRGYKCDVAVRNAGATISYIGDKQGATERQLREALNDGVAAILLVYQGSGGQVPLDRIVCVAKDWGIPVLVDAAGAVPPKENLWKLSRGIGADAVIVSGGKGVRATTVNRSGARQKVAHRRLPLPWSSKHSAWSWNESWEGGNSWDICCS